MKEGAQAGTTAGRKTIATEDVINSKIKEEEDYFMPDSAKQSAEERAAADEQLAEVKDEET